MGGEYIVMKNTRRLASEAVPLRGEQHGVTGVGGTAVTQVGAGEAWGHVGDTPEACCWVPGTW